MAEPKENFASNDGEAYKRFGLYKQIDPYPDIVPSLLNSADIRRYIKKTGMVYPFYEKNLKSASYAARIQGECKYWDEEAKEFKTVKLENEGDKLTLNPNSIAFVGIEPTFRLPDYIAIRFNLKITHVYRGLLLGTGPLVDPGFEGKINIPLHNLTSNEYVFHYGEELIWIEFTKTTPINDRKKFVPFPDDKKYKELSYYINKALTNNRSTTIASSIPKAIETAKESAKEAKLSASEAEESVRMILWGSLIAAAGLILAIVTLIFSSWNLQRKYIDHTYDMTTKPLMEYNDDLRRLDNKFKKTKQDQDKKIKELEQELKRLKILIKKDND